MEYIQKVDWKKISRISWYIGISYFFSTQLFADAIWIWMGGSFAFAGYFILLHLALWGFGMFLPKIQKYLWGQIISILFIGIMGYLIARMLVPEFWYLTPLVSILGGLLYFVLLINLVVIFINLVKKFSVLKTNRKNKDNANPESLRERASFFTNPKVKIGLVVSMLWLVAIGWGYMGFSQAAIITDPYTDGECPMRLSFYGYPFGSTIPDYYNTTLWDQEAAYYQAMKTCFILPMGSHFGNMTKYNTSLANVAQVFHALDKKGLEYMIDLNPYNELLQDGDFFVYYYVDYMLGAFDRVVAWVEENNFTHFRGIELDPEGPRLPYDDEGTPIQVNTTQHAYAYEKIQGKIDKIAQEHPDWIFTTIAVTAAMFDWVDGDRDSDIMLKSISAEPFTMDYYGWQTYMIQPHKYGSIEFYEYLKIGFGHYGKKMQPWIGWLNYFEELEEHPETYENMLTQIKICKHFESEEVVLAPSRYFLGMVAKDKYENHSIAIKRLGEMNQTLYLQFKPFKLAYLQNRLLYDDFPYWIKKINPHYFAISGNIVADLLCEVQFGWLMWYQIAQAAFIIIAQNKEKNIKTSNE